MIDSHRKRALDTFPELRDIAPELDVYENLLRHWQARINLVGASTIPELWWRHFANSAQVLECGAGSTVWTDLGSGAGFPGMVIALLQRKSVGGEMHLIESDQRKAAFLREVSRETGAGVAVHCGRVESVLSTLKPDYITSRAMASMRFLFESTRGHVENGAVDVFLKGRDVVAELTQASIPCNFTVSIAPSRVDPDGRLVRISLRR